MSDDRGTPWGSWDPWGAFGPGWGMGGGRQARWQHGGHGRGGHPGPPPWLQDIVRHFGGPEFGPPRGPRARRGDVRAAILDVLAGDELNGYQVIQRIAERTGGAWKPSPGSVYPTIQQLEDEGLVTGIDSGGRRLLRLTDEGRLYVEEHAEEMAATWEPFGPPRYGEYAEPGEAGEPGGQDRPRGAGASGGGHGSPGDLRPVIGQVMAAMWQVMSSGTPRQRREAAEILTETRRRLYGLLAEGDPQD